VRRIDHPCAEARRIYSTIEQTLPACCVCPRHGTKILCRQEEQAACPETSHGVVGRSVWPPSPHGAPLAMEEEDKVKEIEREGS